MDFSCYVSFDLTKVSPGINFSMSGYTNSEGNWTVTPPATLAGGAVYGAAAPGSGGTSTGPSACQLADLVGVIGSDGGVNYTGPNSSEGDVTLTCTFSCPVGLDANTVTGAMTNNPNATYGVNIYSGTPGTFSDSFTYEPGVRNSGHPLWIIFEIVQNT